jgi:hypothetical protein
MAPLALIMDLASCRLFFISFRGYGPPPRLRRWQ